MFSQPSFGGLRSSEDDEKKNEINPLVSALGATSAAAGSGLLIDAERRKRLSGNQLTLSQAAKESVDDMGTALRILTGRSAYDKQANVDQFRPNISGNAPADAKISNILDYAKASAPGTFYSLENSNNPFSQFAISARDAYQPSSEDFLSNVREFRTSRGQTAEGPRSSVAFQRIPSLDAVRDLTAGKVPVLGYNEDEMKFRKKQGISLQKDNAMQALGSAAGRTASDFINNGARSLWWLINAPQAVSDLISEELAGRGNKFGLYGQDLLSYDEAEKLNLIDEAGNPKNNSVNIISDSTADPYLQGEIASIRSGVRDASGQKPIKGKKLNVYGRKRTGNNLSTLLALPSAIAINAGLGLTNPLGGSDGYKAVLPSEEDPTVTRNAIAEVAHKYILGRRGDILPWEEFKKVRPDVSKDDYMRYKAYKYSKGMDLNPLDGDWNLGGILKGTDDGIEGGEVMFLGKHMPTDTVLMPTLAAAGGAAVGAAFGRGGYFNLEGIHEGQKRRGAQRSQIAQEYGLPDNFELDQLNESVRSVIDENDVKTLRRIDRQMNRAESRQNVLEKVLDAIPSSSKEDIGTRRNRITRRSPIITGLIGGAAALGISSIAGHENERRRREQKIAENAQRNHFNGMDAGL